MHAHVLLPFSDFEPQPLYNHVHVPDLQKIYRGTSKTVLCRWFTITTMWRLQK